ncbi:MAG TPA: hypothetical protein GXZ23_06235 [Clostridiales bacterium]|nr:hypothetical protein [Clostridiales bacterium]
MIRINDIKVPLGADVNTIKKAAAKALGVSADDFLSFSIARESIDSRRKNNIMMTYSVDVRLDGFEEEIASKFEKNKVLYFEPQAFVLPENKRNSKFSPVIVGLGPAGLFCGLMLARSGLNPIIIERGNDVDTRKNDIANFWKNRKLNTESNVQFGEGGAGTFSDGKLTTGIKDGRVGVVLQTFKDYGAPHEITFSAKPHIGTDKLGDVIKNIRNEIIRLGGTVKFGCKLVDIITANGFIQAITYTDEKGSIHDLETDTLILCIGHSPRDTIEMLYHKGINMEKKAFSVGTRIEHPQEMINEMQYGKNYNKALLPPADYKLSNHPLHGRGGYTFCMCPGGTVVLASSEENMVVVNGMSEYARDGENANSAILVGIEPDMIDENSALAGIKLQREIEQKAFEHGGSDYTAPCQLVGDMLKNQPSKKLGSVNPSCPTGTSPGDIRNVLPSFVVDGISDAIIAWDKKLRGFALNDAVLTFPESRSSSPVRIIRDEFFQTNIRGIFPCGEGAGYAGGIVSAGVDGIRAAEAVLRDET